MEEIVFNYNANINKASNQTEKNAKVIGISGRTLVQLRAVTLAPTCQENEYNWNGEWNEMKQHRQLDRDYNNRTNQMRALRTH